MAKNSKFINFHLAPTGLEAKKVAAREFTSRVRPQIDEMKTSGKSYNIIDAYLIWLDAVMSFLSFVVSVVKLYRADSGVSAATYCNSLSCIGLPCLYFMMEVS